MISAGFISGGRTPTGVEIPDFQLELSQFAPRPPELAPINGSLSEGATDGIYKGYSAKDEAHNTRTWISDILDKQNTAQLWIGGMNMVGNFFGQMFQHMNLDTWFTNQKLMNRDNANAAVTVEQSRNDLGAKLVEATTKNHERLYGPDGFAERHDRIVAHNARAMHQDTLKAKKEMAALRYVDQAFSVDSRSEYSYGDPFSV